MFCVVVVVVLACFCRCLVVLFVVVADSLLGFLVCFVCCCFALICCCLFIFCWLFACLFLLLLGLCRRSTTEPRCPMHEFPDHDIELKNQLKKSTIGIPEGLS